MTDNSPIPPAKKMLLLTVIVRSRDSYEGKPVDGVILSLYKRMGISGATVTHGARGYGIRGEARADVLGLSINLPVIIETVVDRERVDKLIPEVRRIVGGNGLVTTTEVSLY